MSTPENRKRCPYCDDWEDDCACPWSSPPATGSPPAGSLADHAAFMRQVRANLPRVTSADAHAQARRVLAAAREQDERARNITDEHRA